MPPGHISWLNLLKRNFFQKRLHEQEDNPSRGVFRTLSSIYDGTFCKNSSYSNGSNLVGNYMFKVNNRNTRIRCEICSKLTIKTPERRY